jgi:hypothetical protein
VLFEVMPNDGIGFKMDSSRHHEKKYAEPLGKANKSLI